MLSRALNGVPRPVFYKGEQVGEWREYDERLAMFILRNRRPARFGKWIDRMLMADPFAQEDADESLDDAIQLIDGEIGALDAENEPDSQARVEE